MWEKQRAKQYIRLAKTSLFCQSYIFLMRMIFQGFFGDLSENFSKPYSIYGMVCFVDDGSFPL